MLNSVFLFHGENTYTLRQELLRWKTTFLEKYGKDAFFQFTSQNWDLGTIKQALYAGGLFVSKKMIIIEGVPKDLSQDGGISADKIEKFFIDFQENSQYLSPDTVVIFLSNKPDKRTKVFKRFSENVQVKTFDSYKEPQLKAFITDKLKPFHFGEEEMNYFLLKVGNDLYRIANEIEKLKFGLKEGTSTVSREMIDYFCFGMVEGDAFSIFDQLFSDPEQATLILKKMQDDGKSWNEVSGLLTWGLKIYLTLLDFQQKGITDTKAIIAETRLHPFVVSKNMKNLQVLLEKKDKIISFLKHLIDVEYSIKTGIYPDHYFWLAVKKELLSFR